MLTIETKLVKGRRVFAKSSAILMDEGIQYLVKVFPSRQTKSQKASVGVSVERVILQSLNAHAADSYAG